MSLSRRIIGAMSGTSADGVDAALVDLTGRGLDIRARLIAHAHEPYPPELRERIFAIRHAEAAPLAALAELGRSVTLAYARAVKRLDADLADVTAIAAHGQTLYHAPPLTIQWFDPSLLAHVTGCAVVSDFRRADCAAGGQGAPLVPLADWVLFRDDRADRVLLNLGGIANITFLRAGAPPDQTIAFDTGPGNCISDELCRRHNIPGGFDAGGRLALSGTCDTSLAEAVLASDYFARPYPKSTDTPEMIRLFDRAAAGRSLDLPDLLATAAHVAAEAVRRAIASLDLRSPQLIVAGGGVHNRAIMDRLGPARLTDDFGIPPAAREAVAFAVLGAATLDGVPGNIPRVTGAERAVVLGSITPKP
jgi:anhydro-N-acetylmuramic acid kinase